LDGIVRAKWISIDQPRRSVQYCLAHGLLDELRFDVLRKPVDYLDRNSLFDVPSPLTPADCGAKLNRRDRQQGKAMRANISAFRAGS
jgi:hypothetical protein